MSNHKGNEIFQDNQQLSGLLAGLLIAGGLLLGAAAGAGTMLLLAPQAGKKTRKQLWRKWRKMRRQTAKTVKQQADQVHDKAQQITTSIQDLLDDQKERWDPVIEAGKTAVQGS
jgi:gas vesicle protein